MHVYMYAPMYGCMDECAYVFMHVRMYVFMYACMYVCMCLFYLLSMLHYFYMLVSFAGDAVTSIMASVTAFRLQF